MQEQIADLLNVTVVNHRGRRLRRYWTVATAGEIETFQLKRDAIRWAKERGANAFRFDNDTTANHR